MKKNNGITLIALIITIVVMLILVIVSIRIAMKNGLFESAGKAGKRWEDEQTKEIEFAAGKVNIGGTVYNSIDEYIAGMENGGETTPEEEPEIIPPAEKTTVAAGERASKNSTYTDTEGKKAVIPEGFTVSGTESENVIDEGLVIYLIPEGESVDWTDEDEVKIAKETYDQFVWIPINDINDMYMCQSEDGTKSCNITVENGVAKCQTHNSNLMAGRLYVEFDSFYKKYNYISTLTTQTYTADQGLREPDVLKDEDDGDMNNININKFANIFELDITDDEEKDDTVEKIKVKLQEEYNEIVKSVCLNKGFYCGRYETSYIYSDPRNPKVIAGEDWSIVGTDWYYCYEQSRKYTLGKGINESVGSTMIQGAAYDQILKYVHDKDKYDVTKTGNVGHSKEQGAGDLYKTAGYNYREVTEEIADTYIPYNDVTKNIYDLEGNLTIWTTEASDTDGRALRGGEYDNTYYAEACSLYPYFPNNQGTSAYMGMIMQLYIK